MTSHQPGRPPWNPQPPFQPSYRRAAGVAARVHRRLDDVDQALRDVDQAVTALRGQLDARAAARQDDE